ncbi:MAG: hypothetical protein D6778_07050, partial [Nitrospirae bacterium]
IDGHIKDLQTKQAEGCTRAEAFVEEAVVAFQQLKTIDSLIRSLERETRNVQRLMEELLS